MSNEFARSGPAFEQLSRYGDVEWPLWNRAAAVLERELDGAADLDRRIHHLYLPVLWFCLAGARAASRRPFVVGLQAPQGAGKTTLSKHVLALLPSLGLTGLSVSVDDFYLTREEQVRLAAANPGNPYLEHRGYPGTHDVALGERTLTEVRGLGAGAIARVPVYDKSQHGGRGDRAPADRWREITGPVDVVILEGWMLGFEPAPADRVGDSRLTPPNRALADYDRWHRLLDAFIVLRATDPTFVLKWRVEAEEAMKARGLPGLSREDIEDYVRRFLPAYDLWAGRAPARFTPDRTFVVGLDEQRRAV
jgi:D-glycerate 3-kinase